MIRFPREIPFLSRVLTVSTIIISEQVVMLRKRVLKVANSCQLSGCPVPVQFPNGPRDDHDDADSLEEGQGEADDGQRLRDFSDDPCPAV